MEIPLRHKHQSGRKQGWATLDEEVRSYIELLVDDVGRLLKPVGFVGAYLHGSLAFGSFYRPKSDIDILFVVQKSMPQELRRQVALLFCDHSDKRPIVGDIEVSIVKQNDTLNFRHPLPYELHYGEEHYQKIRDSKAEDFAENNNDPDLAVYCYIIRKIGICMKGAQIEDVFGVVPLAVYKESILEDLDWILEDDHIVETPFYAVLNCCRVLQAITEDWQNIINKEDGARWALANLPGQFHPIIAQSLACYSSIDDITESERRTHGHDWDQDALRAFRDFVLKTR